MFCPKCTRPNAPDAATCANCGQATDYFRERLFIGQQFVFVRAESQQPMALKVDDVLQISQTPTILSRHQHRFDFGDEPAQAQTAGPIRQAVQQLTGRRPRPLYPLPMLSPQTQPQLDLFTVVTDRKIYRPDDKIVLFAVAPDLAGMAVDLEIRFQGQKVYEAQLELNDDGLGLHQYDDLHEGEYSIVLSDPQSPQRRAEAVFTVAEFTLSPLIATLVEHQFADRVLSFKFDVRLLSAPYSGPLQLGLQSQASGDQIVATQQVEVVSGLLSGQFDVTRHGGPFHVQLTTPDGNTAQVDFPGTGFRERRSLPLNPLGQGVELSLLPGEATTPVRGFYLGEKGISVTPLVLEAVHSSTGRLQIAKDLDQLQLVLFDPRRRTSQTLERTNLKKGDVVEFEVAAPYTLFTAGAFLTGQPQPFEGWGIVIPPVNFEATLTAPQTAQPGETIEVEVAAVTHTGEPGPVFCWLLVYDARLEHESPISKLAKQIYQSIQAASQQLQADAIKSVSENPFGYQFGDELFLRRTSIMPMAMPTGAIRFAAAAMSEPVAAGMAQIPAAETATLIETPARMEFPELAYQELFFIGGQTGRTIQLGDQIGLWRVRAYLFRGADYRELTVDVQADKPLYAELNLPAIASDGDRIMASVNYQTHDAAQLTINTRFGETRLDVTGSGTAHFPIEGPTQVDVRLENSAGSDWSVREVAAPGRQTVKASRLALLRIGETAQGERVVVYRTVGEVLKETIDALTNYPFG